MLEAWFKTLCSSSVLDKVHDKCGWFQGGYVSTALRNAVRA